MAQSRVARRVSAVQPFNLAAHAVKCGIPPYLLTSLGRDEFGDRSLEEIKRLGMELSYVQIAPEHPTPTVKVTLSDTGQPTYEIRESVSFDFIRADKKLLDTIEDDRFTAFCFGMLKQRCQPTYSLLHHILERIEDLHVFYDVILRLDFYSREVITASLQHTTILKANDEEAHVLSEMLHGRTLSDQ